MSAQVEGVPEYESEVDGRGGDVEMTGRAPTTS